MHIACCMFIAQIWERSPSHSPVANSMTMQMNSGVRNTSLSSMTWGWRSIRWFRISASTYLFTRSPRSMNLMAACSPVTLLRASCVGAQRRCLLAHATFPGKSGNASNHVPAQTRRTRCSSPWASPILYAQSGGHWPWRACLGPEHVQERCQSACALVPSCAKHRTNQKQNPEKAGYLTN